MAEYSEEMREACAETLHAYRRLIDDPVAEASKWHGFGGFSKCRLCNSTGSTYPHVPNCRVCPLDDPFADRVGCTMDASFTILKEALEALWWDLNEDNTDAVVNAASVRRAWLVKEMAAAGIDTNRKPKGED